MYEDWLDLWEFDVDRCRGAGATGRLFAPRETARGFVRVQTQLVLDSDGREVTSSAHILMFADSPRIPAESRVVLPARFGGSTVDVVAEGVRDSGIESIPRYYRIDMA